MKVVKMFQWEFYGRQMVLEIPRHLTRASGRQKMVYHFCDCCEAPTKRKARSIFRRIFQGSPELAIRKIGPVIPKRKR